MPRGLPRRHLAWRLCQKIQCLQLWRGQPACPAPLSSSPRWVSLGVHQVPGAAVSSVCLLQQMLALGRLLLILTVHYIAAQAAALSA